MTVLRASVLGGVVALVLAACTSSPTAPPPAGPNATVTGAVVERVDGAPYSFLKLETEKGMTWGAVPHGRGAEEGEGHREERRDLEEL